MKSIEIIKKLDAKGVFRVQDIERIAYVDRRYARLILSRLKGRGLIKNVSENAYTTKDDINIIASNVVYPSYISFLYASYFLGYTEQIVSTVQLATTVKKKMIEFENYKIRFVPIKHFFGYGKISTKEGDIFVVENEKLLIDAFLRHQECGNFDEIGNIFENAKISEEKLVGYLDRVGIQSVIKRIGFLLEKTKGIDLSGHFGLDRNYVSLNPFSGKWETLNSKWRVKI